jgi:hypothetical protein
VLPEYEHLYNQSLSLSLSISISMGIDTDIRKLLLEKWAPHAFIRGLGSGAVNKVVVDDVLTWLFQAHSPAGDTMFTGQELCEMLYRRVLKAMDRQHCTVYVALCDDPNGVPTQKARTQAKRSEKDAAKNHPYPQGSVLSLEGIRGPYPDSVVKKLDITRLMRSRHLRKAMWKLMNDNIRSYNFPTGKVFVFDFDITGPWIHSLAGPRHATELAHQHGEADISVLFYLWLFRGWHVEVRSTDTDGIPIILQYLKQTPLAQQPANVIWAYRQGKGLEMAVDMKALTDSALKKTKLNYKQFVLACLVAGTDFVEKAPLAYFFNLDDIFEAAKRIEIEEDEPIEMKHVVYFSRALFTGRMKKQDKISIAEASTETGTKAKLKWEQAADQQPSKKRKADSTTESPAKKIKTEDAQADTTNSHQYSDSSTFHHYDPQPGLYTLDQIHSYKANAKSGLSRQKIPTEEEFQIAFDQISFNMHYWTENWKPHHREELSSKMIVQQ